MAKRPAQKTSQMVAHEAWPAWRRQHRSARAPAPLEAEVISDFAARSGSYFQTGWPTRVSIVSAVVGVCAVFLWLGSTNVYQPSQPSLPSLPSVAALSSDISQVARSHAGEIFSGLIFSGKGLANVSLANLTPQANSQVSVTALSQLPSTSIAASVSIGGLRTVDDASYPVPDLGSGANPEG